MSPEAMEPLTLLLSFGQIVIPLAAAIPPIITFTKPIRGTRDVITICWYVPLGLLALTVAEIIANHGACPTGGFVGRLTVIAIGFGSAMLMYGFLRTGHVMVTKHTELVRKAEREDCDDDDD